MPATRPALTPWFQVIRFTANGPAVIYGGRDVLEASTAYALEDSAPLVKCLGRDEVGDLIPGVMGDNLFLARKFHGVEQSVHA